MKQKSLTKKAISVALSAMLAMSALFSSTATVSAAETGLSYEFSGKNANDAGYAQGTIKLNTDTDGTYHIYWADNTKALDGYYEIGTVNVSGSKSTELSLGNHTAIPAGATQLIAVTGTDLSASNAKAVYKLPQNKLLSAGKLLYTFNSYSDVHIDNGGYYKNAEQNWKQALKFATDKDTDFIVSSGDMVTNASGPDGEWDVYEKILAGSDYLNPVWESDGNHDMRSGIESGLKSFVRASGTDSTYANYKANKPYYYVTEKTTGDIFIFMALEKSDNPSSCNEFTDEQMSWLCNLLEKNYGTGVNIYLIEHSPIKGFGAGDRMSNPYYKAHLSEEFSSTVKLKSLLQMYPKLIWMSGHTHEDYTMGYNYSNENDTAAHMIHNPAVAGSTWASESDTSLDYKDGVGYNSQGYYTEVYENSVIFYGANLTDEKIYPQYSYIMDGARQATSEDIKPTSPVETKNPQEETGATGSTLPAGTDTKRVYFANTLKWVSIDCYSWATGDTTSCVWPGYSAKYYGTSEQGVDLYYCDVPATHENIIWNNAGKDYQTVDIALDGTNNFFTPATSTSSKSVPVNASVWSYDPVPTEPTEPQTTAPVTTEPTEPQTTAPVTTEPTEPQTTAPVTTEPTEPQTSAPVTTEPTEVTTYPVTTEPTTQVTTEYPAPTLIGDVNLDTKVDIKDATLIQRATSELTVLSAYQRAVADVDGDSQVNIKDATLIQKYVAGAIESFPFANAKSKISSPVGASGSLMTAMSIAKAQLDTLYSFSSYDQYQALKKLYYQSKNIATSLEAEAKLAEEFSAASAALDEIAEKIGTPVIHAVGDVYYFENTSNWSTVNCYAWSGSSNNGNWPGVKMQKVGTNYGHDVYGIRFEYAGQFQNLIFNNGSEQTVDIALSTFDGNTFYLDGTSSGVKLNVKSFTYTPDTEPTVPTTVTTPVEDNKHYALCYYNSTVHGWADIDTYLTPSADGTYTLDFTTKNAENISLNIYDVSSKKYNCIAASASMSFAEGTTSTYELVASSSRGKSITVKELAEGKKLHFVYNPSANTLTITCAGQPSTEPTEPSTQPDTQPAGDTYTMYIAPVQSSADSGCTFKANIKDSAGTYHSYTFESTGNTYNGQPLYKAVIASPTFTDTVKVQFQTWDSAGAFVGQVVVEKRVPLSSYNNTIMVCKSSTSGTLSAYAA